MFTPHASRGVTPSPPCAGTSKRSAMRCTSDPSAFDTVQIHTAKCAICDQRNKDTMLRCPGCTYQVCQPCYDLKNGKPLNHGSLGGTTVGLPTTPARRRLFQPGGQPLANPSAVSAGTGGELAPEPVMRSRATSAAVSSGVAEVENTREGVVVVVPAQATQRTPKRARTKKTKSAPIVDHSESDEEFLPKRSSPLLTLRNSKRQKTVGDINSPVRGGGSNTTPLPPRPARHQANTITTTYPTPAMPYRGQSANRSSNTTSSSDPETQGGTEMPNQANDDKSDRNVRECAKEHDDGLTEALKEEPLKSQGPAPGPRVGDSSIQALLEQNGVDTPNRRYKEHLLGRHQPVIQNPVIAKPPSALRNFKPRKSFEQIQRDLQEPLLEKARQARSPTTATEAIEGARASGFAGHTGEKDESSGKDYTEPRSQSLREFVKTSAGKVREGADVNEDQFDTLQANMLEAARKMAVKINRELPDVLRRVVKTFELSTDMAFVSAQQKVEIEHIIVGEGRRVLQEFADEASTSPQPTKRATSASLARSSSPPDLPAVAMFQVSPPKPKTQVSVGASSKASASTSSMIPPSTISQSHKLKPEDYSQRSGTQDPSTAHRGSSSSDYTITMLPKLETRMRTHSHQAEN